MKMNIISAIIARYPKYLIIDGYFDSLATIMSKIPNPNLKTTAKKYNEVFSILSSSHPKIISGLISNDNPKRRIRIPNNLIINFIVVFFLMTNSNCLF